MTSSTETITTPKGRTFTVNDEGVVLHTEGTSQPAVSPVAAGMFNQYQAISIGNMQQRAVGVRTRLQQWTIDSYFRNAIQMGYQLGIIPMPQGQQMQALEAFTPKVPDVAESPELLVAIAKKVGVGD